MENFPDRFLGGGWTFFLIDETPYLISCVVAYIRTSFAKICYPPRYLPGHEIEGNWLSPTLIWPNDFEKLVNLFSPTLFGAFENWRKFATHHTLFWPNMKYLVNSLSPTLFEPFENWRKFAIHPRYWVKIAILPQYFGLIWKIKEMCYPLTFNIDPPRLIPHTFNRERRVYSTKKSAYC